MTALLDAHGEVLDYYDPEIDPEEGYRAVRCRHCDGEVGDLSGEDLHHLEDPDPADRPEQVRLRVTADVNLEASPAIVGKHAAAHSALVQAAEERHLPLTTAADPMGTYVEGNVTGPKEQVVPMLAALARGGHSYRVDVSTADQEVVERIVTAACGAVSSICTQETITDPPMR